MNRPIRKTFGASGGAIVAAYRGDYLLATPFELWAAIAAAQWRIPAIAQATRKASLGAAPAYSYIYSWRTPDEQRPGKFRTDRKSQSRWPAESAEIHVRVPGNHVLRRPV
jgi:para-nitrobenzyl esterase